MTTGKKGFQRGHPQYGHRPGTEPAYCKTCNKQLAKSPSKRGKSGLCHPCAVRRKFDESHKDKISKALSGKIKSPEHCAKLSAAATERFKDPTKVPWWNGGSSFEPYSVDFNEKLRERIRARDGYRCQECFRHQSELGRGLDVHHIDFNKKNSSPDNLIALCASCHNQTKYGREAWTKYYQERLAERSDRMGEGQ